MSLSNRLRYSDNPFVSDLFRSKKEDDTVSGVIRSGNSDFYFMTDTELSFPDKVSVFSDHLRVDTYTFVKLFTDEVGKTAKLHMSAKKVFAVMCMLIRDNKLQDGYMINLHYDLLPDIYKEAFRLSISTFYRGVSELVEKDIIACSKALNIYFVNPAYVSYSNHLVVMKDVTAVPSNVDY